MSLVKGKRQTNTILDFSGNETSRNKIRESLRLIKISNVSSQKNNLTIFDNVVKVGTYNIKLVLQEDYDNSPKKLKEFGRFQVRLFEFDKEINLKRDYRFKKQKWVKSNLDSGLKIKELIDTIFYCNRLHKLKLFL
jgi:hypothetical protein